MKNNKKAYLLPEEIAEKYIYGEHDVLTDKQEAKDMIADIYAYAKAYHENMKKREGKESKDGFIGKAEKDFIKQYPLRMEEVFLNANSTISDDTFTVTFKEKLIKASFDNKPLVDNGKKPNIEPLFFSDGYELTKEQLKLFKETFSNVPVKKEIDNRIVIHNGTGGEITKEDLDTFKKIWYKPKIEDITKGDRPDIQFLESFAGGLDDE